MNKKAIAATLAALVIAVCLISHTINMRRLKDDLVQAIGEDYRDTIELCKIAETNLDRCRDDFKEKVRKELKDQPDLLRHAERHALRYLR